MTTHVRYYTVYERLWHWLQAAAILALLGTGFHISYGSHFAPSFYRSSVLIHEITGLVLAANALFALLHNLSSGLIRRYVPALHGIFPRSVQHASYYLFGIFQGSEHPFAKSPEQRLLPLQQLTYFFVLNLLLPLMVLTGIVQLWPVELAGLLALLGGLEVVAPLHRFGAWLFAAFVVLHVYMTTTGRHWYSNLSAMLTGYGEDESVPPAEEDPPSRRPGR